MTARREDVDVPGPEGSGGVDGGLDGGLDVGRDVEGGAGAGAGAHVDVSLASEVRPALRRAAVTAPDDGARRRALALLRRSRREDSRDLEAEARLALAEHERVSGQYARAHAMAQRAAHLFRAFGDTRREIRALALQSHTASLTARDEEAMDAGLLALALATRTGDPGLIALAQNYVGVAAIWSYDFSRAEASLDMSVGLYDASATPEMAILGRINLAWCAGIRVAVERYQHPRMDRPEIDDLARRVAAIQHLPGDALERRLGTGSAAIARGLASAMVAMSCVWSGDLGRARRLLDAEPVHGSGLPAPGAMRMVQLALGWVEAELAWRRGRHDEAAARLRRVLAAAQGSHWEQFATLMHVVLAQVQVERGDVAGALATERALRVREQVRRRRRVSARQLNAQGLMESRDLESRMAGLARRSEELERLSFQDTLTGLANRRHLEHRFEHWQARRAQRDDASLCFALIDVDQFKQINDVHGHLVGDDVLRRIAGCLRDAVRQSDVAVRLGGDEFVLVLPDTPLPVAREVMARVAAAVAAIEFAWGGPSVTVGVSIGVTEAGPGDTLATVYERADRAMFEAKRGRQVRA